MKEEQESEKRKWIDVKEVRSGEEEKKRKQCSATPTFPHHYFLSINIVRAIVNSVQDRS